MSDFVVPDGEGFSVVTASGGLEGRLARELPPAAITLDVMMPVLDGIEVLVAMRSGAEWRDFPVLVVTAKARWPQRN